MHKLLLPVIILCLFTSTAWAQPDDGLRGSGGSSTCDWTEYKDSIKATESSGTYTACNECAVFKDGACRQTANGMYQFLGQSTGPGLTTYKNAQAGNPPVASGCLDFATPRPPPCSPSNTSACPSCDGQGFNRDECGPLQEAMMDEFSMRNLQDIQARCPSVVEAVNSGRMVSGRYRGETLTCPVTWSGVLAGAHLGGAGSEGGKGVCGALSGGANSADNLGTEVLGYVCQHGGLQVPATDCTPAPYSTSTGGTITVPTTNGWDGHPPPPGRAGWEEPLKLYWVGGLQLMASQLSAVMMQQVHSVGKFFDAKHQLELQRLLQQKYAQAHKDYHPSEQMCEIGTFSRDLLNAEQRAKLTQTAITEKLMDRGLSNGGGTTTEGNISDRKSRLEQYIETFCNIEDNAKNNDLLCETSGDTDQQNMDIDYTRLIDAPLTLDIDLTATGASTPAEIREEKTETNLFAFLNYIFMHDTLPVTGRSKTTLEKFVIPYQDARSLMAMRSVAHNSFSHLIAMKTSGPKEAGNPETASPYLRSLMREMGMNDTDIVNFIGENPSYYAQMEVLTKKIYQNPDFVTNLYDKPANVRRIRTAMTAIKLMQDRDIHEALMRREMLISMILELKLREKQQRLTDEIAGTMNKPIKEGKPVAGP